MPLRFKIKNNKEETVGEMIVSFSSNNYHLESVLDPQEAQPPTQGEVQAPPPVEDEEKGDMATFPDEINLGGRVTLNQIQERLPLIPHVVRGGLDDIRNLPPGSTWNMRGNGDVVLNVRFNDLNYVCRGEKFRSLTTILKKFAYDSPGGHKINPYDQLGDDESMSNRTSGLPFRDGAELARVGTPGWVFNKRLLPRGNKDSPSVRSPFFSFYKVSSTRKVVMAIAHLRQPAAAALAAKGYKGKGTLPKRFAFYAIRDGDSTIKYVGSEPTLAAVIRRADRYLETIDDNVIRHTQPRRPRRRRGRQLPPPVGQTTLPGVGSP